jgi:hypothetical protein
VSVNGTVSRLRSRTVAQVEELFRRYQAGEISRQRFEYEAGRVISSANTTGTRVADLAMAAQLTRLTRTLVLPVGLEPTRSDQERLRRAVAEVLDARPSSIDSDDLTDSQSVRLARLASNEPAETFVVGMQTSLNSHQVSGWVRQTDSTPCPLCTSWADGLVRPPTMSMNRHTGCACWPMPVLI